MAAGAAQLGASVALIEGHKMGGDCLNYGCVPSKALLAAAKRANVFRSSEAFGIQKVEPKVNFEKLHDHIHEVIAILAPQDSVERFEKLSGKVIQEKARFLSPNLVQAGNSQVKAKYFVIATESSPTIVPLLEIENVPYLTNETIFELKEKPRHLIVVGGGPIGFEIAQAYRLLGVKVTLLGAFALLPKEDPEVVSILRNRLKNDGIDIFEGVKVLALSQEKKILHIQLGQEGKKISLQGTHLLMATGRKPNVMNLGLKEAGVQYTPKGIEVDKRL